MFNKKIEQIFTVKTLLSGLDHYKHRNDYQDILKIIKSGQFIKTLSRGFIPDHVNSFMIPKNEDESRELALTTTSNRVIQKILSDELSDIMKFSDKSYAFRRNKGTLKAINRTKDFLNRYFWVIKTDIDNFFDSIDHEILIKKLNTLISDKRIIKIIALFLKNGMVKNHKWIDKEMGIYQGYNLSPVLSNIYLDEFDKFLESRGIDFVRFADDMVIFSKHRKDAFIFLEVIKTKLKTFGLQLKQKKTYVSTVTDGFEFLGIRFIEKTLKLDNDRLQKHISKISKKTKYQNLDDTIESINNHITGYKSYYGKILSDSSGISTVKTHIDKILIKKIVTAKTSKTINNKVIFREKLSSLKEWEIVSDKDNYKYINDLIAKAYDQISFGNPLENAQKQINKRKKEYLTQEIKSNELILSRFGLFAGISRGKAVIKERGKILKTVPLNKLSRVIIMSKGVSISSGLIFECSRRKVDMDFIDNHKPYALITYQKEINNDLHLNQLKLKNSDQGFEIAREIVRAKGKNQINLIKYYYKYRKRKSLENFSQLEGHISEMEIMIKKLDSTETTTSLMGYEGNISRHYWASFGILIGDISFQRHTQGATDPVNQALNYGYGFLYNRIQSFLIKKGVNIYYSFLHSEKASRPTLVYDMVEEFRQPVVDREIISILNRGTKITSSKGKLSQNSLKVITQHIQSRFVTPNRSKYGRLKLLSIMEEQISSLVQVFEEKKTKYRGFIARY